MFKFVVFEVSGSCNARCKYCMTGSKKDVPLRESCGFVTAKNFQKGVERLYSEGLASEETEFHLYNWGEPFINPEIKEILAYLNSTPNKFIMSTNAGYFPELDSTSFTNLRNVMVSMPGFSQESYDRIHGFKFEKVLENIDRIIEAVGQRKVQVIFHRYKVNGHELEAAKAYFKKKYTVFRVFPAYLAYYNMAAGYLDGRLDTEFLEEVNKEVILDHVPELLAKRPDDYRCPQYDMLTVDENCRYVTCDVVPKSHPDNTFGSVFEMSRDEVLDAMDKQGICKDCQQYKIDYWVHNSPVYSTDLFYKQPMGRLKSFLWYLKRPHTWFAK